MPAKSSSITPLDALWQAPIILWVMLAGEALALILTLAPERVGGRWVYFGLASLLVQWVFLCSLGALYLLRRWLTPLSPVLIAQCALGVLALVNALVCGIAWWQLHEVWLPNSHTDGNWRGLLSVTGIVLTFGLLGLAAFQSHWRSQQAERAALLAEQAALRARINPHFLFNTLNTGVALVHERPQAAEQLLLDLADLFRAALHHSGHIPLDEELELARRYLEIERLRFGERLHVVWTLPEKLPEVMVPALSVQPLVENAIHHGVEPSTTGCTLHVSVESSGQERVHIIIVNDLPEKGRRAKPSRRHGVGLAAVRQRLQVLDGNVHTRTEDNRHIAVLSLPAPIKSHS